ncbi:NnrS family protein [Marinicella sp. S1101]|nr:NnrS family protein [Marinicella marina]
MHNHKISILNMAFRPFFLMGSLLAMSYIMLWVLSLYGQLHLDVYGGIMWWHIHEMLFGFVGAIVIGFLLTAVKTWTGLPSVHGSTLVCLVLLWLMGRIFMFAIAWLNPGLIALIDLAFLPIAGAFLAIPIIKKRMWRNLIFLPILLLMTYANGLMHCATYLSDPTHLIRATNQQVFLVTLLMVILGGRVIPMFTANSTQTPRVGTIPILEWFSILSVLALVLLQFLPLALPAKWLAGLFTSAALIHFIRLFRWRFWVTLRTPLVWSLHLSYACIPLGYLLFALSLVSDIFNRSQAIHTLTVGAISLMILAMISRVSLGHTGRKIVVGKTVTVAFLLVFAAFIIRVFGTKLGMDIAYVYVVAAVMWSAAFALYLIKYSKLLISPRIDKKPG